MIPLELTHPAALITLLALPVIVWYSIRSLSDFPKRQQRVSLAMRLLVALLLVLSLAGLTWLRQVDQQYVLFLLDESESIGNDARGVIQETVDKAVLTKGNHQVAFLPFDAQPGQLSEGRQPKSEEKSVTDLKKEIPEKDAISVKPDVGPTTASEKQRATNIAAAIESAVALIPAGYVPRIVLLTDGNETNGDAVQAAMRARVPISTLPLPNRSEKEVQVSDVIVPDEVREGEPFYVEVVITSNHDDTGLVEIYRGDHKVVSERKDLKAGENRFRFQQSIERERLSAYSVRISGLKEDTLLDNNSGSGLVFASGKPRVLIIESDPGLIRELAYALEDEGIQADIRPPQGMPDTLTDIQNYELVIVSNVPATALSAQQMQVARTYVQELGGGFIMLGGEQSFGLGGYYKSVLEEILPVRSDFEKEQEKPSLAMVLVIDKSGSMSGDNIEMAKSAANSAIDLLGRRDQVAVIAFDGETYPVSPMQSVSNKAKVQDDISRIEASGGTNMYPAMELGFQMLQGTSAKLKHMILLTDGESMPGDFEGIAEQMVVSKMTVSTVGMGSGAATDLLEQIARIGKGRYYFTEDPSSVPQIFAKETVTASKSAIDEQPFIPQVVRATHALAEIDFEAAPFLLGYVMTRPKPTSEVILSTEKGDPLLAWWRYGLGMTAAFTSDAKSRWAAEWLTWPGYGKFWTQIVRQLMRKSDSRGIVMQMQRRDQQLHLKVDAVDLTGRYLHDAQVEVAVINPSMKRELIKIPQVAPGRYEQTLPVPMRGQYHLDVSTSVQGHPLARQSRGLSVGYDDELRIRPTNEVLLRTVAETSGGRYAPAPEQLFDLRGTAQRPVPLWPWLVTMALLLFLIDVALRRIDFSLHWPFNQGHRRNFTQQPDSNARAATQATAFVTQKPFRPETTGAGRE